MDYAKRDEKLIELINEFKMTSFFSPQLVQKEFLDMMLVINIKCSYFFIKY